MAACVITEFVEFNISTTLRSATPAWASTAHDGHAAPLMFDHLLMCLAVPAGDAEECHLCIGRARRMMVKR
jgi:hypothetical protein